MSTPSETAGASLRSRLLVAGLGMAAIFGVGTFGYYLLGRGRWGVGDCAYMTVISLTTTGFGEVLDKFEKTPYARLFTGFLLVGGAGVVVYFVSALTTFLVEGEFLQSRRRKKMQKLIENLAGHIIVCGAGGTGRHVVAELVATGRPFVVVDPEAEPLARLLELFGEGKVAQIQGDATDDNILIEAGIQRAFGVVASLPDDKGNLYVVVTARGLNPQLRIVAKAVDANARRKLEAAGANAVISVNAIGGLRMASEMIRPHVVGFLDKMMRDQDKALRFEELTIPRVSLLVGRRLAASDIRKTRNLLIVAAKNEAGEYTYSPGPDFVLEAGMTLIVIGESEAVQHLRASAMFTPDALS